MVKFFWTSISLPCNPLWNFKKFRQKLVYYKPKDSIVQGNLKMFIYTNF